jgi:hypothetical protein
MSLWNLPVIMFTIPQIELGYFSPPRKCHEPVDMVIRYWMPRFQRVGYIIQPSNGTMICEPLMRSIHV